MWYDKVILELEEKKTYSRKELFVTLQADNPQLSHNSFKWVLADIISRQMLTKIGYDSYTRCKDERNLSYQYRYSEIADEVREKLSTRFPAMDFCIFEAFMLNEFLDVPLSKNCIVLQVEKDKSTLIFNFLSEEDQYRVLYKPNKEAYKYYWSEDCVIVTDRISEAPQNREKPHDITLEKLIVDVLTDVTIRYLLSENEGVSVIENILKQYCIDEKKMMRYARRRNAEQRIKEFI